MKYKNKFCYPGLLKKIFNKSNLNKTLIIFIIGFISRILINYAYNINILSDYLYQISGIYYIFASVSIIVHEFINYFYITVDVSPSSNSIPKFKSTVLKMEPSREIIPSNKPSTNNSSTRAYVSNRFNTTWQERYDEEMRLKNEKGEEANRLKEENKRLRREDGKLSTEEGLESQRRWLVEKHIYPHLTYKEWDKIIDAPRRITEINHNPLHYDYSSSHLSLYPIVNNPVANYINAVYKYKNNVMESQVMEPQASTSISSYTNKDYFNSNTSNNYNNNHENSTNNTGK